MSASNQELDRLLQSDTKKLVQDVLGTETWFTADCFYRNADESGAWTCALIPAREVTESLSTASWDADVARLAPDCFKVFPGGEEKIVYDRFGNSHGFEPLVVQRSYHGVREPHLELLEEFRLFHNLFHDRREGSYVLIDDAGNGEVVAKLAGDRLLIRQPEVRRFLSLKEMHLALYFTIVRYSSLSLEDVPENERRIEYRDGMVAYDFDVMAADFTGDEHKSFSRMLGKKLVPPLPKEECGRWPYQEPNRGFEQFIIGLDESGHQRLSTSNPDELANSFGGNPGAPHYLTPVYFRPQVLTKYYANPDLYTVSDGCLRCGDLWAVRVDNNHPDFVVVFLGDLGRDLPHSEQLYWRASNVPADAGVSAVNFRRSFLGQFASPEKPDLLFKFVFDRFSEQWIQTRGWPLFKPLCAEDAHYYAALHVPLTGDQAEFDAQVQALCKVLIESLNAAEMEKATGPPPPGSAGITKLERFLQSEGFSDAGTHIGFLRDLQDLRSGMPHRKGRKYEAGASAFQLEEIGHIAAFGLILRSATALLEALGGHFLGW